MSGAGTLTVERQPASIQTALLSRPASDVPPPSQGAVQETAPAHGRFGTALLNSYQQNKLAVIAEIKRRSPSRGELASGLDVAATAQAYEQGGAAAISVLTDTERFGAQPNDIEKVRQACSLPILRKDFLSTVSEIKESKEMGADAVLLIVRDLAPIHLERMLREAEKAGLDALVEVRDGEEISMAIGAGAAIIAVNQRTDPTSPKQDMDYNRAADLASILPGNILKVAASGIGVHGGTPPSVIVEAGYEAVLVGESLLTSPNPAASVSDIRNGLEPSHAA